MEQDQTVATQEVTEAQLAKQIAEAAKSQDWTLLTKLSRQMSVMSAGKADAQRKAKEEALVGVTLKVKEAIEKTINSLVEEIENKGGEGIWFAYEFGELNDKSVRLMKTVQSKAKTSSGGSGGKKCAMSTEDMLKIHGEKVMNSETSETYQQYYDANTGSNPRYKVRMKLIDIQFPKE